MEMLLPLLQQHVKLHMLFPLRDFLAYLLEDLMSLILKLVRLLSRLISLMGSMIILCPCTQITPFLFMSLRVILKKENGAHAAGKKNGENTFARKNLVCKSHFEEKR